MDRPLIINEPLCDFLGLVLHNKLFAAAERYDCVWRGFYRHQLVRIHPDFRAIKPNQTYHDELPH
jgi:hypothetical protein